MKNSITAAAVAAFAVIGGAAMAAPMTVTDTIWFGGNAGQLGVGATMTFGTSPTVTASGHSLNSNGSIGANQALGQWDVGLGVCSSLKWNGSCNENHMVDSDGPEVIKLEFSQSVTIKKLWFSYVDGDDDFSFSVYDSSGVVANYGNIDILGSGYGNYTFNQEWTAQSFGVGAQSQTCSWYFGSYTCDTNDAFKLKGVEFSYTRDDGEGNGEPEPVPLPASGLLLIAGLGAVAGMKRRRKA